jgi:DNA-directed RNA polymerase sigma subunit (sigma70/sigma32)
MFAVENSQNTVELGATVERINRRLGVERASLRRALRIWIQRVVLATRMPDEKIPEVQDLVEAKSMLRQTDRNWQERWKR